MNQLESALVLVLRDTIKWESATVNSSGTLAPVTPSLPFDCLTYQCRDRQLAYRDLILGAACVEVSVQVGDVWNYSTVQPTMQGASQPEMIFNGSVAGSLTSQVRHVLNSSVPYDAARYADADLYGRDSVAYEILARACNATFLEPSIAVQDSTGTVIPSTAIWSLAQGQCEQADINAAKALDRDLFKHPDQNLADRDNLLAAYVANLAQVLKNPFASALRLYIQVQSNGTVQREPDIYALVTDDGTHRIFQAQPAVPGMNQIVYSVAAQTLQWFGTEVNAIEVPQIYAITIPGVDIGQTVTTLAKVPNQKDAQYWRGKAGQLLPAGDCVIDISVSTRDTSNTVIGGLIQSDAASLTVPGQVIFELTGTVPAGDCRVSMLATPCNVVTVDGLRNTSSTSGTLTGADYAINVASGAVGTNAYLVNSGDGIVYAGGTYFPGDTFSGTSSVATYTQYGAVPSTVRQYSLGYQLSLPPGTWDFEIVYTNLTGTASGFSINTVYTASGESPVVVLQDLSPVPFTGTNGQLQTISASLDIANSAPFDFTVNWTGGSGQLHLRQLVFTSTVAEGFLSIDGAFFGSNAPLNVTSPANVPCVLRWETSNPSQVLNNIDLTLNASVLGLPVKFEQVQVQSVGTYAATPLSSSFAGWRQECLDRAASGIKQSYAATVAAFGTGVPTFRDSGSNWSPAATEGWMSFAEVGQPRLRSVPNIASGAITTGFQYEVITAPVTYSGTTYAPGQKFYGSSGSVYTGSGGINQVGAFMQSLPGHLGRPALVPRGLYFDGTNTCVKAWFDTPVSTPTIMSCQPWMITAGLYVAHSEFWMPELMFVNDAGANFSSTAYGGPLPVPTPPSIPVPTPLQLPPAVPFGLTATGANNQVLLSWQPSTGATGYMLARATSPFGPYTVLTTVAVTSYVDTAVTNSTVYYYEIAAQNTAISLYSSPVCATPNNGGLAPAIPAGVSVTSGIGSITIAWSASAGATSYTVNRSYLSGHSYVPVGTTAGTSFVDTTGNTGSSYYYTVTATNMYGTSSPSTPLEGTDYPEPPSAPAGMSADGGAGAMAIFWWPQANANYYNFYRSEVSGGPYMQVLSTNGEILIPDAEGQYLIADTGLALSTIYYYTMTAVNTGGSSPASVEFSGTTT